MRHTKYLLSPARALHRVLLLELANTASKSNGLSATSPLPFSSSALRSHTSPPLPSKGTQALGASTSPCRRTRAFSTTSPAAAPRMLRNLRDKDIPHPWVRIADSEGTLGPPQSLTRALAALPPDHSLVMVAPPQDPSDRDPRLPARVLAAPPAAICRVVDVKAEAAAARAAEEAAKEAAQAAKRTAQQTKTLELNWAIAAHDLAHKTRQMTRFLDKGMRVEILLARKRGSRQATRDEGDGLVRQVREAALAVEGTEEHKRMEGFVGGVLKMFFAGPKGKRKSKKDKGEEE
ncbi:hypothetical protein F4825DRAFT_389035 [Nemania diffusa]|nr:hypothetical protein F4825DRAFT_389035 [Nemania diffusa]